jgi:hypothetical protein
MGAFEQWFASSRIVDGSGKPLAVWHGSKSPWVERFDLALEGTGVVGSTKRGGIWFTTSKRNAEFYADRRAKKQATDFTVYGDAHQWFADVCDRHGESVFQVGPFVTADDAELAVSVEMSRYNRLLRHDTFVQSVYLSLTNPLVMEGVVPRNAEFAAAIQAGHDGIWAKDIVDGALAADSIVVFNPMRIKSTQNQGTWSLTDPNIRN